MKSYEQLTGYDPSGRKYRRIGFAFQLHWWIGNFSASLRRREIFFGFVVEELSFPTMSRRVDKSVNDNFSLSAAAE